VGAARVEMWHRNRMAGHGSMAINVAYDEGVGLIFG
jgi:hypothetical protein